MKLKAKAKEEEEELKTEIAEDEQPEDFEASVFDEEDESAEPSRKKKVTPASSSRGRGRGRGRGGASQATSSGRGRSNKRVSKANQKRDVAKPKRTKERTITDIIEKVSTWRKLYNGILVPGENNEKDQLQRWSLEEAAQKVGVSKKSLDDYLLQLRFGKKFKFDFEAHKDSKVGVLRMFVKQEKDKIK